MDRVSVIQYQEKEIVLLDFSNGRPQDTVGAIPEAMKLIAERGQKTKSLVLTDVTGAIYNKDVAEGIKDLVKNNTPYIKASAVVGADGVRLILLQTVIYLSRRDLKTFSTRQEAMDWLVSVA